MTPPQVLWILSVDPTRPPDGQIVYSLSLIRALAATGTRITVLHLGNEPPVADPVHDATISWEPVGAVNRDRARSVASRLPAMAYTSGSAAFRHALEQTLEQPWDAVVIDHVQSGWSLEILRRSRVPHLVHVSHNHEAEVRRRVAAGTTHNWAARAALHLDARKVAALERRIVAASDLVTTITDDDASSLRARAHLVLSPGYAGDRVERRVIDASIPRRAVVAGSMLWHVKQHDLLALLKQAGPRFAAAGAEIVIAGPASPEFTTEVERTTTATRMLGAVASLTPVMAEARLALVSEPHGGGFKLKTLDYVFHRVPMAVAAGSIAGLPLRDGEGLLEFRDNTALVDGALHLIDDFATLNRVQDDAYDRCAPDFEWADRGARLREALDALRG